MDDPTDMYRVELEMCQEDIQTLQLIAARERRLGEKQRVPAARAAHEGRANRLLQISRELNSRLLRAKKKAKR